MELTVQCGSDFDNEFSIVNWSIYSFAQHMVKQGIEVDL